MGWIMGGLHSFIVTWGGSRVDYIFELLHMGWIRGGLHFRIFVNGVDYILGFLYMGWIRG